MAYASIVLAARYIALMDAFNRGDARDVNGWAWANYSSAADLVVEIEGEPAAQAALLTVRMAK